MVVRGIITVLFPKEMLVRYSPVTVNGRSYRVIWSPTFLPTFWAKT